VIVNKTCLSLSLSLSLSEAVLPDRALYLPTFSHFLIVNTKLLSLSLSLSTFSHFVLSLSLTLSLSLSLCGMACHPCLILRATSLSLQGEPANIGKG
jgi:hypothetical protein